MGVLTLSTGTCSKFLNPVSNNLGILIIQHLTTAVPRLVVLLFTRKKASSMKQAGLSGMFKKASKSVCTSTLVVSPDPLSPTPSTCPAMKTPEDTYEYHVDPKPADGDNPNGIPH
jgi:hypothetical protein